MCRAAVANGRGGEVVAALPRARLLRYALTASSAAVQGLRVGAIRLDTTEYKMLRAQCKKWTPCAKLSPNGEVKRPGWESLNASKYDESDVVKTNATLSHAILASRISKGSRRPWIDVAKLGQCINAIVLCSLPRPALVLK